MARARRAGGGECERIRVDAEISRFPRYDVEQRGIFVQVLVQSIDVFPYFSDRLSFACIPIRTNGDHNSQWRVEWSCWYSREGEIIEFSREILL